MNTEISIMCKLGGYKDSHPEMISSYPFLRISEEESRNLIFKCLPMGSKVGDIIVDKFNQHNLLSYVFKNKEEDQRADLLSFSLLIDKKLNIEIYKHILEEFFSILTTSRLLSEIVLKKYDKSIFEGFNQEIDVEIEHIKVPFSELFKKAKDELIKPKPKMKGSFF